MEAALEAADDTATLLLAMRRSTGVARAGVPAMSAVDEVMETLKSMTLLEASELVKKIEVLKVVRELTGLGLKDAKDMVEKAPCTLKEGASKAECDEAKAKLEEAGAKVDLK